MRTREEINKAPSFPEAKMLEVLLDIRELLIPKSKIQKPLKVRKPRKVIRRKNASGK